MPAAEQAKDKAVEAIGAAKEKLEVATKEVIEATKSVGKKIEERIEKKAEQQAAVAVQEKNVATAEKVEEKVASVVEKIGQAAFRPGYDHGGNVVIDNNNGKVVLSHKRHAETYGCAACHGDQKPARSSWEKRRPMPSARAVIRGKRPVPPAVPGAIRKRARPSRAADYFPVPVAGRLPGH